MSLTAYFRSFLQNKNMLTQFLSAQNVFGMVIVVLFQIDLIKKEAEPISELPTD